MDQEVTVKVPVMLVGQSEGIKAGGVLNQTLTEIEISCLPGDIPQNIDVDITNLNIGDSIRLENLSLPNNLTIIGDTDLLIVSIVLAAKIEEPEEVEADDTLESSETETEADTNDTQNDTENEQTN